MDITNREIPTREVMLELARLVPELNVSAAQFLMQFMKVSAEIRHSVYDVLEREYRLSEGKLTVMINLYQSKEGMSPSQLAEKAGVTRATISAMVRRLIRDGLACSSSGFSDGRAKVVTLTGSGRNLMDRALPEHFLRTARLVENMTEDELEVLLGLLKKIRH